MISLKSFQSILGKFIAGNQILVGLAVYNPNRSELKTAALEATATDAAAKNAEVIRTGNALKDARNNRRFICFRAKETDANCIENLIRNIASYLKSEFGVKSTAYVAVETILKKIQPVYDKPEPPAEGEEPAKSISKSEKSFASMVGYGNDVYTTISDLGSGYAPANQNITAAAFKTKVDQLADLNKLVTKSEDEYKTAVAARQEIFKGEVGIESLMSSVKDHLASWEGGKNNAAYKAYANAVK